MFSFFCLPVSMQHRPDNAVQWPCYGNAHSASAQCSICITTAGGTKLKTFIRDPFVARNSKHPWRKCDGNINTGGKKDQAVGHMVRLSKAKEWEGTLSLSAVEPHGHLMQPDKQGRIKLLFCPDRGAGEGFLCSTTTSHQGAYTANRGTFLNSPPQTLYFR